MGKLLKTQTVLLKLARAVGEGLPSMRTMWEPETACGAPQDCCDLKDKLLSFCWHIAAEAYENAMSALAQLTAEGKPTHRRKRQRTS